MRDTSGVVAPDAAAKREPTPIGALFEAAFRRYGAELFGYTLWSVVVALIPGVIAIVARDAERALFAFVPAQAFGHFLLCAILTVLVTGHGRERLPGAALVALFGAAVTGAVFAVVGPFAVLLYPLLVFGPIGVAAGDTSALRAPWYALRLALGDWWRCYGVLLGLGIVVVFLWFAFFLSLMPIGGAAHAVTTLALTTLVFSPVAALVERNLYGDATGRRVLPEAVSVDQRDRGKQRKKR